MVSVIIPVYNVSKYIARCARSLFEQSLHDIEYIFVDDCTQDNSVEIVKSVLAEYPDRIAQVKIVSHRKNQGLAAARNTGLRHANGEYIAHCDSDDWVERDMYEKLYYEAKSKNLDLVACDYFMEYDRSQALWNEVSELHQEDKLRLLETYISSGFTVIWNKLVRRDIYFSNNITAYEGLDFCEDYGLSVRLMYWSQRYGRYPVPLYHYNRTNVTSYVAKSAECIDKYTDSMTMIYSRINDFFKEVGSYPELEKVLSWRMLCAKRGWLKKPLKREQYLTLFPESNKYINNNPLCVSKDKFYQHVIITPIIYRILYVSWFDRLVDGLEKLIKSIK